MNNYPDPSIHMLAQPGTAVVTAPTAPAPDATVTDETPEAVVEAQEIHEAQEVPDEDPIEPKTIISEGDKSLGTFINMAQSMSSQTVLHAVSGKLFDHFTIWDLMLAKAKKNADQGALTTLVNDTALVLCELKILIENCLDPIHYGKMAIKKKSDECIEFDDMMTYAMGLETNLWLKRSSENINYHHQLLNVENLFPPKKELELMGKVTIKKEVVEEEETDDDDDEGGKEEGDDDDEEDREGKENDPGHIKDDPEYKPEKKKRKVIREVVVTGAEALALEQGEKKKRKRRTKAEMMEAAALKGNGDVTFAKKQAVARKRKRKSEIELEDDDSRSSSKEKHLCLKCGQSMNKESGKKHEEKCNGMYVRRPEYKKVDDEYFCTVAGCNLGYGFNSMYGLRKHFHGKHTREEEKFFACDYCDEKFSFRTTRNKHITEKHMKNHVCDICGKGFGGRSKMMQHRFLHTGEKPFACTKCDYRAAKKCNLEAHLESKHSVFQQKNFICAICNKQFVTMGRVRRHMAEIHADGLEDDGESAAMKRRRKRHRVAPPPEAEKRKRIVMPPPHIQDQQQQQVQQVQQQQHHQQPHHVNEQDAAVQYLQTELGHGNETVITVRPLF